mmetsp:Transcript_53495/g.164498  ORF Transcript_53495/g.164498 Transcript_53495/m.164498 type:complete len:211 (-) Transcript_53495:1173-1805(-)
MKGNALPDYSGGCGFCGDVSDCSSFHAGSCSSRSGHVIQSILSSFEHDGRAAGSRWKHASRNLKSAGGHSSGIPVGSVLAVATAYMTANMVFPCTSHGFRPKSSSTRHPMDHTSALLLYPCASSFNTSGAMKSGVPTRVLHASAPFIGVPLSTPPMSVVLASDVETCLLQPKSASLASPLAPMSTLSPFKSRCTTPFRCRYSSPCSTCRV